MYSRIVVPPDRLVDGEHQLAEILEPRPVSEVHLELRVEGFLVPVPSGRSSRRLPAMIR